MGGHLPQAPNRDPSTAPQLVEVQWIGPSGTPLAADSTGSGRSRCPCRRQGRISEGGLGWLGGHLGAADEAGNLAIL
jgi:hypothetical protein